MSVNKTLPVCLLIICTIAAHPAAQTLGQFNGASAASDGEGSVFMLAGSDAFRTGVSARFNISSVSDFGLQIGLDRSCSESFFGGGVDLKIVVLQGTERLPVHLALDAAFGSLASGAVGRFLFDFGVLASGRIGTAAGRAFEPYCSLVVEIEEIDMKRESAALASCLCPGSNDETHAGVLARVGVKVPVSKDGHLLIEASLDEPLLFGAGFNIIF